MKACLKEFIQNGVFGSIELGMNRADVENIIGSPKCWHSNGTDYQRASIWKYGDVEFYFQNDKLWMIFMDDFKAPKGETIELDNWFIRGDLPLVDVEKQLSAMGIGYQKINFPYAQNGVHLVTNAGTVLAFSGEDAAQVALHALYGRCEL